jgi:hypothetical protein
LRRLVLKLALVVMASLLPVVAATSHAVAAGDPASDFVARINALRTSKGLHPLAVNAALTSFAAGWTNHMASTGVLSHNPNLASAPNNWTVVGENVGDGTSVPDLFQAFVNSPHHYENLVDPRFNTVGVSVVIDGGGRMWTTHNFEALPGGGTVTAAPKPTTTTTAKPRVVAAPAAPKPASQSTAPAPAAAPVAAAAPPAPLAAPPAPLETPARIRYSIEKLRGADPTF